jgi:hypothetical protein
VLIFAVLVSPAYGQDIEEEKFTTLGPIGISNKYKIPENRRAIIFRIKNYTSRSINQIFGRVFMISKLETDPNKKFLLINNPHKGGNILKGKPHRPGTVSEWNFTLARKPIKGNKDIEYTLQIHPRSIFFSNIEPKQKPKGANENP